MQFWARDARSPLGSDRCEERGHPHDADGALQVIGQHCQAHLRRDVLQSSGESYGTHSLRRTKVSVIYKRTGNLRAVQILLGHTKLESEVRYLGVDIEDALTLAEATDI